MRVPRIASLVLGLMCCWIGCSAPEDPDPESAEPESVSVTVWNEQLELFMEHPPLRPGVPAKFAVHLTDLSSFQPVRQGPVEFRFEPASGPAEVVTVEDPLRAGIFGPEVTLSRGGPYRLVVDVRSPSLEARVVVEELVMAEGRSEALPSDPGGSISYLKEQQWQLPFATATASREPLQRSIPVPATLVPRAGREAVIIAPMAGRFGTSSEVRLGNRARRGQVLGWIEPLPADQTVTLGTRVQTALSLARLEDEMARAETAVVEAEQRLELARLELERTRRLLAMEAVPEKRLEQAEAEMTIRQKSLETAVQIRDRLQESRRRLQLGEKPLGDPIVELQAPLGGTVVEIQAVPGSFVEAGAELFRIIDLLVLWVSGRLLEKDLGQLERIRGARLELTGHPPVEMNASQLVTLGQTVDATTRTVPVIFELPNPEGRFRLGSLGRLSLRSGEVFQVLAAPRSAVLLEEDKTVVYVQVTGESFERRVVRTGIENPDWVEILEGLEPGDRIVTVGAYEVALASRSTQAPVHGHAH